jgi:hypothetical protein
MPENFVRPGDAEWDRIAAEATNVEQLREAMKQRLQKDGFIQRKIGWEIGEDTLNPEAEQAVSAVVPSEAGVPSERRETFFKVIYPGGNDRYQIFGASEQEVAAKEQAIRAMYSGKC